MALVSLHLVNPAEAAPAIARLADTLVGAAIAHLFSHLWPRWEFAEAPRLARAAAASAIDAFAAVALRPDATAQDYRLARKALIEAIAALSDSAARMGGEPAAAQRGLEELTAMLIAAHGVVAQLSAARIALQGRRPGRGRPGARRSGGGAALAERRARRRRRGGGRSGDRPRRAVLGAEARDATADAAAEAYRNAAAAS